jgi:hypothetical protein
MRFSEGGGYFFSDKGKNDSSSVDCDEKSICYKNSGAKQRTDLEHAARKRRYKMTEPIRIPPQEVKEKVLSGAALLVCGYDDPAKFKANHLQGSISYEEFNARLPNLSKDQEIIFYCA